MPETKVYDLVEADMLGFKMCAFIVALGKRGSGKSSLCQYLMGFLSHMVERFVVYCGNKENVEDWHRCVSPLYCHEINVHHLARLVKYQDERVGRAAQEFVRGGGRKEDFIVPQHLRITVVLDDCGSRRDVMNSSVLKDLAANARHYGIYLVVSIQFLYQMSTSERENVDYIICMQVINEKIKDTVWKEYLGDSYIEKKHFKLLWNSCTSTPGNALMIDNTMKGNTFENRVRYITMPWPIRIRKVGGQRVRRFAKEYYLSHLDRKAYHQQQEKEHKQQQLRSISHLTEHSAPIDDDDNDSCISLNRRTDLPLHYLYRPEDVHQDTKGNMFVFRKSKQKAD